MTQDDVLFGYRLQLFDLAARTAVSRGVSYLRGAPLDLLRVEAAGRPARPGDVAAAGAAAAADAQPALGDGRGADRRVCARPSRAWAAAGRLRAGAAEVGRAHHLAQRRLALLCRHGLNTRAKRLSLVAGYRRALRAAARAPAASRTSTVERPGELVGIDCFFVGRLRGTDGAIWQLTAIDCYSSLRLGRARRLQAGQPDRGTDLQARPPRRRRPESRRLAARAHALPTTATSSAAGASTPPSNGSAPAHPHPRRPAPNQRPRRSAAQDDPRRVLAARLRPLPLPPLHRPQPRTRPLPRLLQHTTASTTAASPAAASPQTSSTVPAKWRPDEPHPSAHLGVRPA